MKSETVSIDHSCLECGRPVVGIRCLNPLACQRFIREREELVTQIRATRHARELALPVLESIANDHGVTVDEMMSKSRYAHVVAARRQAMAVLRWSSDWSFPRIGRLFNRDHTTVMASITKYECELTERFAAQP